MAIASLTYCNILGVRCVVANVSSAADAVVARALSGAGGYSVLCNVHVLMTADRDAQLMQALDDAWAVFADGAPVAWLQRRTSNPRAERVGGPDLMPAVIERGRALNLRHALYGSTPRVIDALAARLRAQAPDINIVMVHAPEPGEEFNDSVLRRVAAAKPHVVWCALGAPKQEIWMRRAATVLAPSLLVGVGAAFDFHAGAKRRAPRWTQRIGLEWAYRLTCEPRRLAWRYMQTNSEFIRRVPLEIVRSRRRATLADPPSELSGGEESVKQTRG